MMLNAWLSGATVLAAGIIALFFLRYWRQTRDRLFLLFSLAFVLEGIQRTLLFINLDGDPNAPHSYLIRLCEYLLILAAIVQKNRRRPSDPPSK